MTYTVRVAFQEGEPFKTYGPFDTHDEAYAVATPFAEEGLDVEIRTSEAICDFCSRHEVAWAYKARDFGVDEAAWGSRGGWAACEGCHELIEKGDDAGLVQRSFDNFDWGEKGIPDVPEMRVFVIQQISRMHEMFRLVRIGPAIPAEESDGR